MLFWEEDMDNNYNSQPVTGASKGLCLAAMICGIAGFVMSPVASIAGIVMSNICKNKNGGVHNKQTSIGFKCGVGSLIMWGVIALIYIIYLVIIGAAIAGGVISQM